MNTLHVRQKFTTRTTYTALRGSWAASKNLKHGRWWPSTAARPANQPQLSRGDKTWRNSTTSEQWQIASDLHPSRSPTTGKMHECRQTWMITCSKKWLFSAELLTKVKTVFSKREREYFTEVVVKTAYENDTQACQQRTKCFSPSAT